MQFTVECWGEGGAYHVLSLLTNEISQRIGRFFPFPQLFCLGQGARVCFDSSPNILKYCTRGCTNLNICLLSMATQCNNSILPSIVRAFFSWHFLFFFLLLFFFNISKGFFFLLYSCDTHPSNPWQDVFLFLGLFHPRLTALSDSLLLYRLVIFVCLVSVRVCVWFLFVVVWKQSQVPEFIFMEVSL